MTVPVNGGVFINRCLGLVNKLPFELQLGWYHHSAFWWCNFHLSIQTDVKCWNKLRSELGKYFSWDCCSYKLSSNCDFYTSKTWTLSQANGKVAYVRVEFVCTACINETCWVENQRIRKVGRIEHGSHWYATHKCVLWYEVTCTSSIWL